MDNNNNNNTTGGIGFLGALTLLFIGLKLTGYIDWSWWLITLPMTLPLLLVLLVCIVVYFTEKHKQNKYIR